MFMNHVGVINRTVQEAENFYGKFLGMEKLKDFTVTPKLSKALFAISEAIRMIAFEMGEQKIEVFIFPQYRPESPGISHFGLLIDNFEDLMKRAQEHGVTVISGSDNGKTVYFLKDFSGNIVEIKSSS